MNKIVVSNGYIELDLRNERADNDNHILFYKDSKFLFWILRTKENQFKTASKSESIKIKVTAANNPATAAVQQFRK